MSEDAKLDNFDWVKARAECSLGEVFEKLKLEVEQDVERRNAMRSPEARYAFRFVTKFKIFTVFVESNTVHSAVKFVLTDSSIQVRDEDNNLLLEATLTLNDEGECRLLVKGQERTLWQFRRIGLEKLFFSV